MNLISVIVPVYNVAPYLRRCVDSLLVQTYQNLEIILIDDGSTDESGQICDEYLTKDSRIQVIHKENGGPSSARNAGLNRIHGQFVTFVDSDDFVLPEYCQRLLENLLEHDADISKCLYVQFSDPDQLPPPVTEKNVEVFHGSPHLIFQRSGMESMHMKMFRREIFHTIRFPQIFVAEDSWIAMDILATRPKVVYDHRTYYYYYVRNTGLTGTVSRKKLDRVKAFYHWIDTAQQYAPEDSELLSLVAERWLVECISAIVSCYPLMTRSEQNRYKKALAQKYQELLGKATIRKASKVRFWIFQASVPLYCLIKKLIGRNAV